MERHSLMLHPLVRTVTSLLLLAATMVAAEDWPTFMHDNDRSGVSQETLRPPLSLAWTFRSPFPPAAGWSPPVNGYGARKNKPNVSQDDAFRVIVADGICYFCSSAENKVVALDAATGETAWEAFTDAAPRLAPVYWNGRLLVGADDGIVRCLNSRDGAIEWIFNAAPRTDRMLGYGRFSSLWPIRSGGIVDQGIAYFTAGLFPRHGIYLCAVRVEDGSLVWRRRLDQGGLESISPQGHILAASDSLWLTSRVAPTRWSKADGSPIPFSTPFPDVPDSHEYRFYNGGADARLLDGRTIVYGQACMLGYDPDVERKDKWGKTQFGELAFNWFGARQIAFVGDKALVATDEHLLAVNRRRLPELSRQECRDYELTYKRLRIADQLDHRDRYRLLVDEYGPDDPRAKEIADGPLKWGRESWEQWPQQSQAIFERLAKQCDWMTPLSATEAMIVAGDTVFAGGEDRVFAIGAQDGRILWSAPTNSRVRGLAAAAGRLFVSTVDGSVRCFARHTAIPNTEPPAVADGRSLSSEEESLLTAALDGLQNSRGYALIRGDGSEELANRLAHETGLQIEVVASSNASAERMRGVLSRAKVHGGRVCVHVGQVADYPPYLFNLVIDWAGCSDRSSSTLPEDLLRATKPCGGIAVLPHRGDRASIPGFSVEQSDPRYDVLRRGRLPEMRDWTHNYATPAGTYCSEDPLVKGPFGILWYGEPGPQKRIERHATPPMPLVVNGVMFTIGYDRVMAYDVYNGVALWEREIQGATRTSLPVNTSNLAADDSSLFIVIGDRECWRLDAHTGRTLHVYQPPVEEEAGRPTWAWIAQAGDLLYGSLADWDENRRKPQQQTSHGVFALDVQTGRCVWSHLGAGVDHDGIAISDGHVFLVEKTLTREDARRAIESTVGDQSIADRDARDRRGRAVEPDLRKLVSLDAKTGKLRWQQPWNMTDVTLDDTVVLGRAGVACMVKEGVVVVHGTGSLGHPHREFLAGEFARRAIYAFDSATGEYLWGGRKGYRKRPIIIGDHVYAEPFAWDLHTGKLKRIPSPLSGEPQVFDFHRGYIGCGHLLGSAQAIFGARGGVAYCNLDRQTGFTPFAGMALACGSCAVPADGVYAVPEGRSGCTCDVPIHTSITFYPKPSDGAWSTGMTGGLAPTATLPVKHVSVNLGAPGFRQDGKSNLWIPYPARVGAGMLGDWLPTYQHNDGMCYRLDDLITDIKNTESPWIYTSGYQHDKPLRFRLTADGAPAASYTIRLHFAEPEDIAAGERVFSVRLQGETVLEDFDIIQAVSGARRALVKQFSGVEVAGELIIQLVASSDSGVRPPILCGFQALRDE